MCRDTTLCELKQQSAEADGGGAPVPTRFANSNNNTLRWRAVFTSVRRDSKP